MTATVLPFERPRRRNRPVLALPEVLFRAPPKPMTRAPTQPDGHPPRSA